MATQQSPANLPEAFLAESVRPSLYGAAVVTYFLATTALTLRFVARRMMKLHIWLDDYFAVVAWLGATAFFIDSLIWIHLGLGVHYQILTEPYMQILHDTFLNLFIEEFFYSTATVFVKLSLLAFFWRIFQVPSIRWPIRILATAVICWLIARYIAITLHCIPVAAYWDKTITNAHCGVNDRLFFMGTNTVNFIMDLMVLILPVPYIKRLQVKRSQKVVVFFMFTLGGFVVAVSIILLIVCYRLDNTSPDVTWNISPVVLWAGTEINLGVVSACLPSLRPILSLVTNCGNPRQMSGTGPRNNSYGLGSKASGSKSRTLPSYSGGREGDEYHPFSVINKESSSQTNEASQNESSIDLEDMRTPPQDRIARKDEFRVDYSNVAEGGRQ